MWRAAYDLAAAIRPLNASLPPKARAPEAQLLFGLLRAANAMGYRHLFLWSLLALQIGTGDLQQHLEPLVKWSS